MLYSVDTKYIGGKWKGKRRNALAGCARIAEWDWPGSCPSPLGWQTGMSCNSAEASTFGSPQSGLIPSTRICLREITRLLRLNNTRMLGGSFYQNSGYHSTTATGQDGAM